MAAFAAECGGAIVTKALYARTPRDADGYPTGVLYTTEVSPGRYRDPGIAATAHLFQAKIVSVHEMRVTVVGEDFYAAAIHRQPLAGSSWRRNHRSIRYEPCEGTAEVRQGTRRLMDALGLSFGALDFAVDEAGVWWFYEINANGQWFWIERQTGLPLAAALARLLEATA